MSKHQQKRTFAKSPSERKDETDNPQRFVGLTLMQVISSRQPKNTIIFCLFLVSEMEIPNESSSSISTAPELILIE